MVWSAAYVFLPPSKLYEPMWKYDLKTLSKDLSAHLAYGAGTSVAFRALAATRRKPKATDRALTRARKLKDTNSSPKAKSGKLKVLKRGEPVHAQRKPKTKEGLLLSRR